MIEIVSEPIDTQAVLAAVSDNRSGAALLFLGTTREFTDGRQTTSLDLRVLPRDGDCKTHGIARPSLREMVAN